MAQLTVMGEWIGPGERLAAETLAAELPDAWEVIAGRKLPGVRRDDVDLLVIGDQLIFLLDEKHWGPTVIAGDARWLVNNQPRANPLDRANHLARVTAGLLAKRVPHWEAATRGQQRVTAGIVLSREDVRLLGAREHDSREIILTLADASEALRSLDRMAKGGFAPVRASALAVLKGLPQRDDRVTQIGPYTVEQELSPLGRARCFLARQDDEIVLLRCYPLHGWGTDDPETFIRREERAIRTLAALGRTWQSHPLVREETRQWLVVPVVPPPDSRSLLVSLRNEDPARPDGHLPTDVARQVVQDAFRALHEVHGAGLVHRGLHPRRIWLGRQMRVGFSDFYLARMEGQQSIALWVDYEDIGRPYRAPECSDSLVLATGASDVYSLALSLAQWVLGDDAGEPDVGRLKADLDAVGPVGELLVTCLNEDVSQRPTALAVAEALAPGPDVPGPHAEPLDFVVGAVIKDRYTLERRLGSGAFATTWAAWDADRQRRLVIKQFHDEEVAERARQEYEAAEQIRHANCARVYDIQMTPPPGFLVNDYIDGVSLRERSRDEPLQVDAARKIAMSVLEALGHIHGRNLVHGDISAGNIIVTPESTAVLIDFGLAGQIGARASGGTPLVMAPEVLGGAPASVQSDIYAFAACLTMAMLGRPPYRGDPADGPVRDSTPAPPTTEESAQWGAEGAALLNVLFKALDPDPAKRPSDAQDLARQLRMARPPAELPGEERINPTVNDLRLLYRGSSGGNAGNRGLDEAFAVETYVETLLDTQLAPAVLRHEHHAVLLTGNPGDGKTSFLAQIGNTLRESGARELDVSEAGWRLELDGHTFIAVYDASESHNGMSSDELIYQALRPGDLHEPERHTALIAANDGRLLQFFTDFEDEFEELAADVRRQINGGPVSGAAVVVDLKRRALSDLDGGGLAVRVAEVFTDAGRWAKCSDCVSRGVCPMRLNAEEVRDAAANSVGELVLTSHLRRRRRATFRDVRSALAWLITGDLTCERVHEVRQQGLDPSRALNARLHDLAFDASSRDYLVREWTDIDPALVASPETERAARVDLGLTPDPSAFSRLTASTALRRLFMGTWAPAGLHREGVRPYRYLDEFCRMLQGRDTELALRRLLLGLSRVVGAPRYDAAGLAISEGDVASYWAVLKQVPAEQFSLQVEGGEALYVESIPDRLTLQHAAGPRLPLTLDTVELVLRAADGEVLNDVHSDAVRQELDGFAAQLQRQSADAVRIVDPAGAASTAVRHGTRIRLETT